MSNRQNMRHKRSNKNAVGLKPYIEKDVFVALSSAFSKNYQCKCPSFPDYLMEVYNNGVAACAANGGILNQEFTSLKSCVSRKWVKVRVPDAELAALDLAEGGDKKRISLRIGALIHLGHLIQNGNIICADDISGIIIG